MASNEPPWQPYEPMKRIDVKRSTVTLDPDRTHVLARPFRLISDQRSVEISARVMALPEENEVQMIARRYRMFDLQQMPHSSADSASGAR